MPDFDDVLPPVDFDEVVDRVRHRRVAAARVAAATRRRGVAIHEAAHAIVSAELGVQCDGASVIP